MAKDRYAKEGETCSATNDCLGSMRCVESQCQLANRSVVGDYQLARARTLRKQSKINDALIAYQASIVAFGAEVEKMPAEVVCEMGGLLANNARTNDEMEEAARTLHQCVYGVPVGSNARMEALAALSKMDGVGLDPNHLARREESREYLTLKAAMPADANVRVTIATTNKNGPVQRKLLDAFSEKDFASDLKPCLERFFESSGKKRFDVPLQLKHSFRLTRYEDFDRATLSVVGEGKSGDGDKALVECVRSAVADTATDIVENLGRETKWTQEFRFKAQF